MAEMKPMNVMEFDLGMNVSQVRNLEGKELEAEQKEMFKMLANKETIYYNDWKIKPTVDQVFKDLETVDEVVVKLDRDVTLRIERNNRYWLNSTLYGVTGTSKEAGFTNDPRWLKEGIEKPVSVNYTGQQRFRKIIGFLLK